MNALDADIRRFGARRIVRGAVFVALAIVIVSIAISAAHGHRGGQRFSATGIVYDSDSRLAVGAQLENALQAAGVAMLFVAFVLGSSFVGADFNAGSLTSQLLFESRRWRLHTAKACATAIGCAAVTATVLAVLAASMFIGSAVHGVVADVDGSWWIHRAGALLRISAVAGAGGAMAYGVTLVGRRSSAGIIAFFLQYPLLFLIDPLSHPFGFISHYAPLRALLVLIVGPLSDATSSVAGVRTMAGGLVITVAWTLVIFLGAGRLFSRAEVR